MAVRYYLDDVELVGSIEVHALEQGLVSSAHGGNGGSSGIQIDDPDGVLDIVGWRRFHVEEDTATPPRIWTGFIGARQITDGDLLEAPGVGRVWDATLNDLNFLLGLRCFRNAVSKRPAESDVDRIDWALAAPTGGLTGVVFDNGGVQRTFEREHDESDLRGRFPEEMFAEMAMDIRAFFLYWDPDADPGEEISLFYGFPASSLGTLDAMISNDETDGTPATGVFAPLDGWQQTREPGFTYSGIYLTTKAGTIYRTNSITASTYITRDDVVRNDRIGRASTAEWWADVLLERGSVERDILTVSVEVDEDQVNEIREGYAITVRITNLPGYETPQVVMVQRRTVKRAQDTTDRYQLDLTLSNQAPATGAGGGGDPGGFPHQGGATGTATIVQSAAIGNASGFPDTLTATFAAPPTPGNVILAISSLNLDAIPTWPSGYTEISYVDHVTGFPVTSGIRAAVKTVEAGEGSTVTVTRTGGDRSTLVVFEVPPGSFSAAVAIVDGNGPPVPMPNVTTNEAASLLIAAYSYLNGGFVDVPDADWTLEEETFGISGSNSLLTATFSRVVGPGTYSGDSFTTLFPAFGLQSPVVTFTFEPALAEPPAPGQLVGINPLEYVTMAGTSGTTAWAFADGSLRVFYDNMEQTAAILSYDGAAGTFVMAAAPIAGMQVTVQYQGR